MAKIRLYSRSDAILMRYIDSLGLQPQTRQDIRAKHLRIADLEVDSVLLEKIKAECWEDVGWLYKLPPKNRKPIFSANLPQLSKR